MAMRDSNNHDSPKGRQLAITKDKDSNRLDVHFEEDGDGTLASATAHCNLVGLLPINSNIPALHSYENALAIQLAIKHLNEGDGSVVEEITGLGETCPITFSASFLDTRRDPTHAFAAVDELIRIGSSTSSNSKSNRTLQHKPCAFVGAMDSLVSKTTALVTGQKGIPQVSPQSTLGVLSDKRDYPLFGRTMPSDEFAAEVLIRFMHETLGIRHIFLICESHPFTLSVLKSMREAIRRLGWAPGVNADDDNNVMYMEERLIESITNDPSMNVYSEGSIYEAIEALKDSDYRFVAALSLGGSTTDRMMEIAYEYGVAGTTDGSHQWWFPETLRNILQNRKLEKDSVLAKAYNGVGYLYQSMEKERNSYKVFVKHSRELRKELYRGGTSSAPELIFPGTPEVPFLNESDWFWEGVGYYFDAPAYSYDATILLGLSACREVGNEDMTNYSSLFLNGSDIFNRLRETNFTGATGDVLLDPETGSRDGHSITYSISYWLGYEDSEGDDAIVTFKPSLSYVYASGGHDSWDNINPHIFSGGKNITSLGPNPDLPPVDITLKVVNKWIYGLTLGLLAIILLATAGFGVWTCTHWNSRVIRASQPIFLLLLCFGVAVMALTIIPISLEHTDIDAVQTGTLCYTSMYLLFIGIGITFSTLFAKMYRINKIVASSLRCKRIKLSLRETLSPVAAMFLFNIIILSLMTKYGPISYEISATEFDTFGRKTEEYGDCVYGDAAPFMITLFVVNFGMVCLALFQSWKARNLSTEFAESRHIANALSIAFVVGLLAFPLHAITQDNPNTDTFIDAVMIAVLSGNILCFIFIPKIIFHTKLAKLPPASRYSSISITSSNKSRATEWGERILTSKPQEQLASENKSLERELTLIRKRAERLNRQNVELQQRLLKLSGIENKDEGSDHDAAAEEEEIIEFFSECNDSAVVDRFDASVAFFKTIVSDANSELTDTKKITNSKSESTQDGSSDKMQHESSNSKQNV